MKNKIMFIIKCLSVHRPLNFFCRGRIWDEHISWMEIHLVLMSRAIIWLIAFFGLPFSHVIIGRKALMLFLHMFQFKRNHQFIIPLNYTIASDFRKCLIQFLPQQYLFSAVSLMMMILMRSKLKGTKHSLVFSKCFIRIKSFNPYNSLRDTLKINIKL